MTEDTQTKVERYLLENPRSSTNKIAAALDLSPSTVQRYLRIFQRGGTLRKETEWWSRSQYHYLYWLDRGGS